MKYFVTIISIILIFVSCKKTCRISHDTLWVVKAQNKTSYDLRLSFFKTSTSSNKKSFFIESANTVNLFYNETENFEPDAVTGRYYDSAAIVFSDGRSISYTSRDSNNTNNVLFIDNYLHPNEDEFIFKIDSVIYNLSH